MNHNGPQILNTSQALHKILNHGLVFGAQESADKAMPLVDDFNFRTWADKILSQKSLALRCPSKTLEEAIYREALLGSVRRVSGALIECIWMGFGWDDVERCKSVLINEPAKTLSAAVF